MSVFKDDFTKSWACKFRYKNWQGETKQHKKTGFSTKKEAEIYEHDFIDRLKGSSDILFQSLYDYYIKDCEARLKPTTVRNKAFMIETKILPYFKNLKIEDIAPMNVRSWQTELMKSEKHYTQTYLKTVNNQLSAMLNFAKKVYGLKENPCTIVGSMGKAKADTMDFWTPKEFNQFIKVYDKPDKLLTKTAFYLLYFGGMRCGELLALTFKDFNFLNNTVKIDKNYARIKNQDIIQTPKTEKSKRIISLPPFVMDLVKTYVAHLKGYYWNDRLFPCTISHLRWDMVNGCKESGVKRIRLHDLRHSHASLLLDMGIPIKQISERLGHEDIKITLETYAHLYKEKETELVDKLESLCVQSKTMIV